jgi:DNA-directed RNA polymerase specialized sigma24 family protein
MDDNQLMAGCLAGRPEAWAELHALVVRLTGGVAAQRLGLDPDAVDDVAQMALVALLHDDMRVLRSFRGGARLSSYLTTIILRLAARHVAARAGERPLEEVETMAALGEPDEGSTLPAFLGQLAPADRLIVSLGVDNHSSEEIARAVERIYGLTLTPAAVRKRKERALARLRDLLGNDEMFNRVGGGMMKKAL